MTIAYLDPVDWFLLTTLVILAGFSLYKSSSQLSMKNYTTEKNTRLQRSLVAGTFATVAFSAFLLILAILGGGNLLSYNFWRSVNSIFFCILIPFWIIVTVGSNLQYQTQDWLKNKSSSMGANSKKEGKKKGEY